MISRHSTEPKVTERWTVGSLIRWATERMLTNGFDEARLHVELLLGRVLNFSRYALLTRRDRPLNAAEFIEFNSLLERRLHHEPLQYIIGETDFMGLPLYVDANVMIPRPETEQLVERTLEVIHALEKHPVEVLDIGTGSGNIAIALAYFAPVACITSIDASSNALQTAARNVERHSVESVSLLRGDVFSDVMPESMFDIIVSNPPYVALEEFDALQPEVKDFEPRVAITDEGDGLRFIRRISEIAIEKLCSPGTVLMEISYAQADDAREILERAGFRSIEIFDDVAGIPRIIKASRRQ